MSKWHKGKYHSKKFYKGLVDQFFESSFLMELDVPLSVYIQTAEWIEQMLEEEKSKQKSELKDAIAYFKNLKKNDIEKYNKVCRCMGWDANDSYPKKEELLYLDSKKNQGSIYGKEN